MSIVDNQDWTLSEKGKKDAERHQQKIDESIRKNVRDVISEESIITKKRGKTVRVPVRGMKDYRFVHGQGDGISGGVGQGDGNAGDVIAKRDKDDGQGGAGNQQGDDYMEAEVNIDYLIEIMFEDLGLPYIREKTKKEQLVPVGWKFETISKIGIQPRVHKNRTMKESIKRTAMYASEIIDETGCSEDDAYRALAQALGDLNDALLIIRENRLDTSINPDDVFIEDDDMRYKQLEEEMEYHSNAVVIAMMDVSGSMTPDKKYIARSMLFWMNEFLKKSYDNVVVKFIMHTTEAKVVDEDTFFRKGESGGTACHTAFDLAKYIIETEFPLDSWNVYGFYASDSEDFDPMKTLDSIQNLLDMKINMLAYCDIQVDEYGYNYGGYKSLFDHIKDKWKFQITTEAGANFYKNEEHHFLAGTIKDKSHVFPFLKHVFFEKKKK